MALLRTLGVAVFPFVLTLQGCGNAGNAPTPAPQLRTFGIRVLNPHNMSLVLNPVKGNSVGFTSISWVEDTPGFPGENSTDGQSVNWVNHTDFFSFSGVGAAHGVMEFHCEDLQAHVGIGVKWTYDCRPPDDWAFNRAPEGCPDGDIKYSDAGLGFLKMDFPHCDDGSEPPSNFDGLHVEGAAQYYGTPEEGDLLQLHHVDNEWVTFIIKDYRITHLPSNCNYDHCADDSLRATDTALAISV